MSIFAPSLPVGSAQGFLPPDGRPCKAKEEPACNSGPLGGGLRARRGGERPHRPGRSRDGEGEEVAPLPASRLAASLRRAPTRGGADPDGPGRASVPGPFPCPGPFRARSAPLRAALPCPPGGSGSLGRGSGAPPPLRPHLPVADPPPTRGGEEEEELRPAGSG